jgi:transcriptional regulator with XRE-family HTH domain
MLGYYYKNMNSIGNKLKLIREFLGYSQNEISKVLEVPQRSISNYESTEDISGLLEYISKICKLANKPLSEFFTEDTPDLSITMPAYIKPEDAALLKIINTSVDIETQVEIKKIFVQITKAILMNKSGRLKNIPEYKEFFGE